MNLVIGSAFVCAVLPAALFVWNMVLYRPPPQPAGQAALDPVSLLIPARNEAGSIAGAVESALASRGVEFEVIVLDDSSTDRTAEIVRELAARHPRLRLEFAPALPPGWNGKQHACHLLSNLARYRVLCFLDADVRLAPDAAARMSAFLVDSRSQLVSGFPCQQTETLLERLLLPLIHFVLLAYLPLAFMRVFRAPGFGAGCGQFIMADREAYRAAGGHSAIRGTMHDGLLLPQLFRRKGFRTDLADLTSLATCRMYTSAAEVWRGLTKNATEGMAAPARILPFSLLLLLGQILPVLLLISLWIGPGAGVWMGSAGSSSRAHILILAAAAAAFLPRLLAAWRYRQSLLSAVLHPFGVVVLLALQWRALLRKFTGRPATWKERAYPAG